MKFAFLMDPLSTVKAYKDTTYYIMLAAKERGHQVFHFDQPDLFVEHDQVLAHLTRLEVNADTDKPFDILERETTNLAEMDVVFIRTDPPFDRSYFYSTLLLDLLPSSTKVVNRPAGLRNWNEKLSALLFPDLTPRTMVTKEATDIKKFIADVGRITLKPIDGHGGKGIHFLDQGDKHINELIAQATHEGSHWIIAQAYVEEAKDGDKRILLLNGEPLGAVLRLHPEGQELNNLDAGGSAHPVELTERDLEVCARLKQPLIDQGILFSGIDMLGPMLTEINVTSPTGLQELCRFSGIDHHHQIIQQIEIN
ncbi:glutathione synthase [Pseudomonadota bacterium]